MLGGEVVITTGKNGAVQGAITDTTSLAPSGGAAKVNPAAAQSRALRLRPRPMRSIRRL